MIEPVPPRLRAAIAADLAPVRPIPPPIVRALWITPLALLVLVAAPLAFERRDLEALGWTWSWGASAVQIVAGLALAAAALRESVPGRSWSRSMLVALLGVSVLVETVITLGSWQASPVLLRSMILPIGLTCLASSAITALPPTVLTSVLAVRAFPTRPAIAGMLAGVGAGLMADAGWRLFCEFSEPSHVLPAHLGGVVVAGLIGALFTRWLSRNA